MFRGRPNQKCPTWIKYTPTCICNPLLQLFTIATEIICISGMGSRTVRAEGPRLSVSEHNRLAYYAVGCPALASSTKARGYIIKNRCGMTSVMKAISRREQVKLPEDLMGSVAAGHRPHTSAIYKPHSAIDIGTCSTCKK